MLKKLSLIAERCFHPVCLPQQCLISINRALKLQRLLNEQFNSKLGHRFISIQQTVKNMFQIFKVFSLFFARFCVLMQLSSFASPLFPCSLHRCFCFEDQTQTPFISSFPLILPVLLCSTLSECCTIEKAKKL